MSPAIPLALSWVGAVAFSLLDGRRRSVAWVATGWLVGLTALSIFLTHAVISQGAETSVTGGWPAGIGIRLRADALSGIFLVVSYASLLAAAVHETLAGIRSRTFPAIMLFMATGLTGLFLTADVFNFYVFFELSMAASFILAFYGHGRGEIRAAFLFVVVNIVGSLLFLIAVVGIYRATGTLDMIHISRAGIPPGAAMVLAAVMLAAFSTKLGLFPFHTWLPPVYRDTSPAVAAVLSGAVANIGSYGLLRLGTELFGREVDRGAWFLISIGIASILYGALLAISRDSVREVLAYSSVSQVGYILLALGAGGLAGLTAVVVYVVVNSLNKTTLFLSADTRSRAATAAFAIGAASVAGIPPASGFLAKTGILRSGMIAETYVIIPAVVVGTALSIVYMFRAYQRSFWSDSPMSEKGASRVVGAVAISTVLLAIGVWPEPLLSSAETAIEMLGVKG